MFKKIRTTALTALALLSMGGMARTGGAQEGKPTAQRTMRAQVTFPDRTDDSEVKSGTKVQGLYTMDMSGGPSSVSYRFNADRIETAYGSGYDGSYDYMEAVFEGTGLDSLWDRVAEVFLEGNLADIPYDIAKGSGKVTLTFQAEQFGSADSFAGLFAESVPMASASDLSGLVSQDGTGGLSLTINSYNLPTLVQDGETAEVYVNVDDPLTIDQILANVSAEDLLGESVEVQCTAEEKAKYKKETIGTYKVTVTATDKYGQTATCYLNIHVVDNVGPTIELVGDLTFDTGDTLAIESMAEYFSITDNGTGHGGTIGDPTYQIDGLPFTEDRVWGPGDVGSHTLKVTVADSSGNSSERSFQISVVDTQAPVISMKDGGDGNVMVGLSRVLSLSEDDFLALFQATDNVTPADEIVMDIEGDFIPSKVGLYDVKVIATDKAGNKGTYTCHVTVSADLPPVFILSDALVAATADSPLSSAQLQQIVVNGLYSGRSVTDCLIDDAEYQRNATVEGSYPVAYSVRIDNGDGSVTTETGKMTVRVVGESGEEEKPSNWELFCRWWTDGWQCFCNWFRGVFTKFKFDCWITNDEWNERFPDSPIGEKAE